MSGEIVSRTSIRTKTVILVLQSRKKFKSFIIWNFEEFWKFQNIVTHYSKTTGQKRKPLSTTFAALTPLLNFLIQHFSEYALLNKEHPRTVPSKSFHGVKTKNPNLWLIGGENRASGSVLQNESRTLLRTAVFEILNDRFREKSKTKNKMSVIASVILVCFERICQFLKLYFWSKYKKCLILVICVSNTCVQIYCDAKFSFV